MKPEELKDRILNIIEPVISSMGVQLEDIDFSRMKGKALLRIFIDKEAGVTIDDCERVSREVEAILDIEDPIPYSYVLEVSSPGLDRPLKKPEDFIKFAGKQVRVITHEPVDRQTFFTGKLVEADNNGIVILLPKDRKVAVRYKNISKARLEVEI